jgi:hypothetical protein
MKNNGKRKVDMSTAATAYSATVIPESGVSTGVLDEAESALHDPVPGTAGRAQLQLAPAAGGSLPAGLDVAMGGVIARVDDVGAQGDVLISTTRARRARTPLTAPVAVVDAQFGGNPHTLHPDGQCFWDAAVGGSLKLGVLTVRPGSRAFLFHREHGALEIAPGTYRLGRQREFIQAWQMVAD